jgi:hypothetical protein
MWNNDDNNDTLVFGLLDLAKEEESGNANL